MGNCCLKHGDGHSNLLETSSYSQSNLSNIYNTTVVAREGRDLSEGIYPTGYHVPTDQVDACKVELPVIVYKHADFTFLVNNNSAEWIAADRVIFILRGLPGSGKSTIVDIISHKFPHSIVCSVDNYFIENPNASRNDSEDFRNANSKCQTTAYNACDNGKSPIVIDNEHIESWEYTYYINLAQKFNYLTIMVHPKTPWRFDIEVLAAKTPHNLTIMHIEEKLKKFESNYPLYFGFFLSQADCESLLNFSFGILNILNEMPDLRERFLVGNQSGFLKSLFTRQKSRLHVTSFFCQKGKTPEAREYSDSTHVKDSIGALYPLVIKSIFFTPRTFGARVELNEEARRLLKLEDNDIVSEDGVDIKPKLPRPVGCRAHITFGCSKKVSAVQTGRDLLMIVDAERADIDDSNIDQWSAEIESGTVTQVIDRIFTVNLNKALQYDAMFIASY